MEKLIYLLKPLFEKYLFTTIISFVIAILGVFLFPDVFNLKERAGDFLYFALLFFICFLVTNFIKYLANSLKRKRIQVKLEKQQKDSIKKLEEIHKKQELEKLWRYVDELNSSDKQYLLEFIRNSNAAIKVDNYSLDLCPSALLNDINVIISTEEQNIIVDQIKRNNFSENIMVFAPPDGPMIGNSIQFRQYKLKDDFYNLLKYSYEKYGKISHFDFKENLNGQDENAHAE